MELTSYRVPKGSLAIRPTDGRDGFKGTEAWIIEACGGRYSGSCRAYVFPESKAKVVARLIELGWDADISIFSKGLLISPDGRKMDYRQAKKEVTNA